jgi:hypothetical protein
MEFRKSATARRSASVAGWIRPPWTGGSFSSDAHTRGSTASGFGTSIGLEGVAQDVSPNERADRAMISIELDGRIDDTSNDLG